MRRLILFSFVLVASLSVTSVATADHEDAVRPDCANITSVNVGYSDQSGSRVVTAFIGTVAPSCRGITYTLHVIHDVEDFFSQVTSTSVRGNGGGDVAGLPNLRRVTSPSITDDDTVVCVYVTTSRGGADGMAQLLDRAPDSGCTSLTLNGSPGDIGHE